MGQTLTHGVYLPDEGERNCYSGLAANWQLLDGAVGTVAEHTTALSGKAPLVHTHTKSDITDFPAYGTAAGTICEGNDSRLSDARTPVAHTHTKSDVTDLLNSNFIPSANNAYDLGSSSYQWNNLYANSYYLKSASAELGITGGFSTIKFQDKNNKNLAGITLGNYSAGKLSYSRFSIYDKNSNNQEVEEFVELAFLVSNQQFYFRPSTNNKAYLGTSNTKWKDFYTNLINGEKPGSLGLPNMTNSQATEVDITDWYIQDPDFPDDPTKKIIDDSVEQTVSSSFPGWLWIQFENVSGNYAYARQTQAITNMSNERIADGLATDVFPTIHFVFPIINSLKVRIRSKSATVRIFPCFGNV